MTATASRFQPSAKIPARIQEMLTLGSWAALEKALRAGLSANLSSQEGTSLFEEVVSAPQQSLQGQGPLPTSLLDALCVAGLRTGEVAAGSGITAVALAAEHGQWAWVKGLLDAGYEVETPEWPALVVLAHGREERYANLLDEISLAQDAEVESQLQAAESERAPEGNVHFFKKQETPENTGEVKTDQDLNGDLYETAQGRFDQESSAMRECVKMLVEAGAHTGACAAEQLPDPAVVGEGMIAGFPPLMEAIFRSDIDYALALIENGADIGATYVSAAGGRGRPVDLAIFRMNSVVLDALINAGAPLEINPVLPHNPDMTSHPLVVASRVAHGEMIAQVAGALSPADILEFGGQSMQIAAQSGRIDVMKKLREVGVPFDVRTNPNGFMPIHQAAGSGQKEVIEFLLRRGQKLTDVSSTGVTAVSFLLNDPELAKHFGVSPEVSNVRVLRPRR